MDTPDRRRSGRTHLVELLGSGASVLALIVAAGCASGKASVEAPDERPVEVALAPEAIATAPATTYTAIINGQPIPAPALKMGDPATIERILDEGLHRNRVMDHLTHLCENIGPRLTGSTNAEVAARWAAAQFEAWGLSNVHLHEWGTLPVRFDRGPSTGKFLTTIERRNDDGTTRQEDRVLREPQFTTAAWAAGTNGPRRGAVVRMPQTDEEFAAIVDQHPGAWVLVPPPPLTGPQGIRGVRGVANNRYTDRINLRKRVADGEVDPATLPPEERILFANISGFISTSRDERVWTSSVPDWRELDPANIPQDVEVIVRLSDYDYLNSRVADGETIYAEFDLANTFTPGPIPCYNVIAEIPGTVKPEEVVIISAHLDSWNGVGSQGTTDNGTGSSVTLEAARLLMAAGAKPERTIRFILWTGEEQGLLGSRAYVEMLKERGELANISAVFVDDGGTNYQGGLTCTDDMAEMLAAATAPVNNLFFDAVTGTPLNVDIKPHEEWQQSGGSDHMSFIAERIPGFFWHETGRADYGYGWHTQHDRLDLAIPEYLRQSATCSAVTAYNLACAETLLPREKVAPADRRRRPARPAPRSEEAAPAQAPTEAPAERPAAPDANRPAETVQNQSGQGGN
jgi:carboxypeptidase Q